VLVSKRLDNVTQGFVSMFVGAVESPGAPTIRLRIGEYNLGHSSYVTLTSVADGDVQRFDAKSIPQSYNWSAVFNGDSVEVDLHVAPGDTDVYVEVDRMRTPETFEADEGSIATICGVTDDRIAFGDSRIGRTTQGCTAWLVSNGAVLSAGHCPVAAGDIVEFNVPLSTPNGNTVAATAVNQYPINLLTVVSENITNGDWQVFGLNANTTSLRTAHNVQGFFRMTKEIPGNGTVVRVTGYGVDNSPAGTGGFVCMGGTNNNGGCVTNANCPGGGVCTGAACCDPDGAGGPMGCGNDCNSASQAQQTHPGTLVTSNVDLIQHSVDTMPGNSGSPIIWEANGLTIGIHTDGGCTANTGSNNGTRFSRAVLETAIRNFAGPSPVYVDASNYAFPSNGGVFEPFHNISQAIGAVPDGGTISLVPGFYSRQDDGNTFTAGADGKAMTFVSPAGSSFIGS
jgi:V8-like Glu-specific endopeptidase